LLEVIDRAGSSRSSFLERAARQYPAQIEKKRRAAKDSAILDAHAERPIRKRAMSWWRNRDSQTRRNSVCLRL